MSIQPMCKTITICCIPQEQPEKVDLIVFIQVYGIDVGYGDVAYKIRQNPKVVLFERTNLRYLEPKQLECLVDLVTLDVSFISVLKVGYSCSLSIGVSTVICVACVAYNPVSRFA